jgi:hypothetical protein
MSATVGVTGPAPPSQPDDVDEGAGVEEGVEDPLEDEPSDDVDGGAEASPDPVDPAESEEPDADVPDPGPGEPPLPEERESVR